MDINRPLPLLAGLSPRQFMRRHWQKKPMLVRSALPVGSAPLSRERLFELAAQSDVESRLIVREGQNWRLRHGPLARRALPPLKKQGWTLLVQGVDLLDDAAHLLLQQFRFLPDARLDDLMISYASDGGGVGPHFDRYDVFLLQAAGRRRWRIGRQKDLRLEPDRPLKILAEFRPEEEFVLDAGDMLYLPPGWAHDGNAIGECMTCSIGFRAPESGELARELLLRIADDVGGAAANARYRDPSQSATETPAAIPAALTNFGRRALQTALRDPDQLVRALGEVLTEPKPAVWFRAGAGAGTGPITGPMQLDRRTRMLYDERHVFINGESLKASGRDARLMRQLADSRRLTGSQVAACSPAARDCMTDWLKAGWIHSVESISMEESS